MQKNGKLTLGVTGALLLGLNIAGLAVTSGVANGSAEIITQGIVDPTVATLGAGVACAVGVDANGKPVRVTDGTCVSKLKFLGVCDANGAIYVAPRNALHYDITDFGAVGDSNGVVGNGTDNTASIQAALTAAGTNGGDVLIPSGTFRTTAKLTVPHQVCVYGIGIASVILGDHFDHVIESAGTINGTTAVSTTLGHFRVSSTTNNVALISGCTNATPIQITLNGHGLNTGDFCFISNVLGTTSANNAWRVTRVDANNFTLDGSVGNGAYTGGGGMGRAALSGIHDIATSFNTHDTITSDSCFFGRIVEQAELWTSYDYNGSGRFACDYFTNGPDITATVNPGFSIVCTSFNSNWDGGRYGLVDDGGDQHSYYGSNGNGQSDMGVRLAGIVGGEFAGSDQETKATQLFDSTLFGTVTPGNCTQFDFINCSWNASVLYNVVINSAGYLRFINCAFSSSDVHIAGPQNAYRVDVINPSFTGTLYGAGNPTTGSIGAVGGPDTNFVTKGDAAPVAGAWNKGDIVWNTNVAAGGNMGWVCTTSGTPGTWKTWGAISA